MKIKKSKMVNKSPALIKVTLEYDDGHKLVRNKEDALPFLIRLAKQIAKNKDTLINNQ